MSQLSCDSLGKAHDLSQYHAPHRENKGIELDNLQAPPLLNLLIL